MHKETAQKNKAVTDEVSSEKHFITLSACLDLEKNEGKQKKSYKIT